jgi:hypothetical protein
MEVFRIRLQEGRRRERGRMRRAVIRVLVGVAGVSCQGVEEAGECRRGAAGVGVEGVVGLKCRGLKTERDLRQRQV